MKSLLWEKAKLYGISPIQIQILLFVSEHKLEISNISYLAKEFNITKATISEAVKVLIQKDFLKKDHSPSDKRRYNLLLSSKGKKMVAQLSDYASPIAEELASFQVVKLEEVYDVFSKLIYKLNQRDILQVQRTCFNCRFYKGDKKSKHYCRLIESKLKKQEIRLDCNDFEEQVK